MARNAQQQTSEQEYAQKLSGSRSHLTVSSVLEDTRVEGQQQVNPTLTKVEAALKKQGVNFVPISAGRKHSVIQTRFGVVVGTIDQHQTRVLVGKIDKTLDDKWQIVDARPFHANEIDAIVRHIATAEKALRAKVAPIFAKLVKKMKDTGIEGTLDDLSFTTRMGHTVSVRTHMHSHNGVWATIAHKHGVIVNRTIAEGQTPENDYNPLVANLVRKAELEELGWLGRKREIDYHTCGHKSMPKTRAIHHNCGCTETTTIAVRKGRAN